MFRNHYLKYLNRYATEKVNNEIELTVKENGHFRRWLPFTAAQKYLNFPEVHRGVLNWELVFDVDLKDLKQNLIGARKVAARLRLKEIPYWAFYSGGKSIHIHIFLNPAVELPEEIATKMEERQEPNLWYNFRNYLAWRLLGELRKEFAVDSLKLVSRRTMIRACGSQHQGTGFCKVYLGSSVRDIPRALDGLKEFQISEPREVPQDYFPEEIREWQFTGWKKYLLDYLKKPRRLYLPKREIKGKLRNMPCLEYLLSHRLPDGWHRTVNLAAMRLKYQMSEQEVLKRLREFNRKNGNPVRDSYIKAQVRYAFRYKGTLRCKFARGILQDAGLLSLCEGCRREEGGENHA